MGRKLAKLYRSMTELLTTLHPEHAWDPKRFKHPAVKAKAAIMSAEEKKSALELIAQRLDIKSVGTSFLMCIMERRN